MISSLWTLCQTCPSVAAGKLDGKYRWTEYRDVPTAARVIEHAPQCSGHSVTESSTRYRKDADGVQHPHDSSGLVHDFMEPTLAIPAHLKIDNQLYLQVLRRSQSEGPHHSGVHGSVGAGVAEPGPMAAWVHGRRRHVTEHQRPEHWLVSAPAGAAAVQAVEQSRAVQEQHQKRVVVGAGETTNRITSTGSSEYQLQFAWPSSNRRMPESLDSLLHYEGAGVEREAAGLLSSSQSRISSNGAGTRSQEMVYHAADELLLHQQQQSESSTDDQPRRRRYKTEYKKKFRPFSLYQYVDGKFQKSSSDKIPTTETSHPQQSDKDTWYREVLELRKKAGEYKYRGLGGELMPQHMADLYAKQFDVWEQVSRRSSLSALALAATTPRPGSEKDTTAANSKRGSPAKSVPQNMSARPGQAQLVLISTRKDTKNKTAAESTERARRDLSQHRSVSAEGSKSRSKSAKPAKSPAHGNQQSGNVTLAIRPSLGAIFHPVNRTPARSASLGPERRMPKSVSSSGPTGGTVPVNKTTPIKARPAHNTEDGGEPVKVARNNKVSVTTDEGKENVLNDESNSLVVIDQEPLPALIKALPEPTRVKSPEQLVVRSPDPVNWTVPLDTGKTFTVTQNIRGGEGSRPHSELRVSMTVRPLPVVPVHSTPTVTVTNKKEDLISSQPIQPDVTAAPATVGAPDQDVATTAVENQDDESEPTKEKVMDVEEKAETEAEEEEPDDKPEEPVVAEEKAQEEKEEPIEDVKETRLATEKELASDPLGAAIVLGKSVVPKEEVAVVAAAPIEPAVTSIVPGTTLRRLEDPTPFLFSRPGTLGTLTGHPSLSETLPKAPRYRVLEAPGMMSDSPASGMGTNDPHEQSHPLQTVMTSSPYKVLEAPSSPPKSSAVTTSSPNASPMSSRSLASDVLEKARTRFDRFWTKKESDK